MRTTREQISPGDRGDTAANTSARTCRDGVRYGAQHRKRPPYGQPRTCGNTDTDGRGPGSGPDDQRRSQRSDQQDTRSAVGGTSIETSRLAQLCEQLRPNIVILDSGFDPHCHLVRLLRDGETTLVVVVLVRDAHRTPQFLSAAAAAGAHATVPRTAEPRRLAEAIRRAHIDRRYTDPALAALTARPKRQSSADGTDPAVRQQMPLSRREYQVLQLVAEGLENSAIAKTLFLSVETVRTHVKSILRKLSARDRTHAVTKAFRSGILIPRPEESTAPSVDGAAAAPPPQHTPATAPAPQPPSGVQPT